MIRKGNISKLWGAVLLAVTVTRRFDRSQIDEVSLWKSRHSASTTKSPEIRKIRPKSQPSN
jgi:hypothetical protein